MKPATKATSRKSDRPQPPARDVRLIQKALLIRRFEERLFKLFSQGKLNGTVHTCIGQEWAAVALAESLQAEDYVVGTHRAHGHFLAKTDDVEGLMAELMGRATGVGGGVGGTQHIVGPGFFSSGIQGGMTPVAAGLALRQKLSHSGHIVCVLIGDGTLGEGVLYETLNIASAWALPLLIAVEQNHYAQSTRASQTTAGTVEGRARAFDIRFWKGNTWDWKQLLTVARNAATFVRSECKPSVIEIETYRLKAHSKGDDNRDRAEIQEFESKDYLTCLLQSNEPPVPALLKEIDERIDQAVQKADQSPLTAYAGESRAPETAAISWSKQQFTRERISDSIYRALREAMEADPGLVLIGEDIEGPYGGAFKVSKDLSQRFPERVRNTPISEAAIVGIGNGFAAAGGRAIVEIMFGDFLTLAFDQLHQHAAKFRTMFHHRIKMPLVVRTPMGGKRGYGPTHSQSIEKHFLGIQDLRVLALNGRVAPYQIYRHLLSTLESPHLVIENKILYTRYVSGEPPAGFSLQFSNETYPTVKLIPIDQQAAVTVVCYGGMLEDVEQAVERAFDEQEIACEIICPSQISPLNVAPILESVIRTGRLLTVEEGSDLAGFGSEVIAAVSEAGCVPAAFRRIGYYGVIPACMPRELEVLANPSSILKKIIEVANA